MPTAKRTNGGFGGIPIDVSAVVAGLVLMAVLLILSAAALTAAGITADLEPSARFLRILALVCITGGGCLAGKKCTSRSWLNGIVSALIGFAILAWLTGGPTEEITVWLWLRTLLLIAFLGMVGGIIGGLRKH